VWGAGADDLAAGSKLGVADDDQGRVVEDPPQSLVQEPAVAQDRDSDNTR
jgi:hypothetical protein